MRPDPQRLHRAGIVVEAVGSLRQLVIPGLVGFGISLGGGDGALGDLARGAVWALALAGLAVAMGFLSWRTTEYRLADGSLRLRRGLLRVSETSVPVERVQAIDSVRGPLQRLFGVVELRIQAAGGGREAEIVLRAVSTERAEELRGALGRRAAGPRPRPAEAPEAGDEALGDEDEALADEDEALGDEDEALGSRDEALGHEDDRRGLSPRAAATAGPVAVRRLAPRDLAVAALTSGQFGLVASLLGGASQVGDDLFRGSVGELGGLLPRSAMGIALAAAGLLLLAWALSVLGTVVAFGGFEVAREGDRLRIRRGLVQRREATIPVPRVHAVRIVEGVLRQPFGLALLRVESAGYAQEAATAQTLFPLVRCTEVPALLRQLLPELEAPLAPLAAPPRRAARRYAALPAGVGLAVGLALATLTPVGPAALVLALPGAGWGWLRHRAAGWRLDQELLVLRFRRLARTTVVVARHRLEERTLSQTPLQRRATLAGFDVSVASGATFGVAHLEARAGQALLAALAPVRSAPRT